MKLHRLVVLSLLALCLLLPARAATGEAPGPGSIRGQVRERGTRRPLPGITVYLADPEADATTDEDGAFVFPRVPAGRRKLVVASPDYQPLEKEVQVAPGRPPALVLHLEPRSHGSLEVVVRARREQREVARSNIKATEAAVVAGSGGDPVMAVESMPGVTRGGTSSFGVPVRGSNPEDSRIRLDGHEIPFLFHMDSVRSAYNSALLAEITLYTGGFGAQEGGATGGVVLLTTREPRRDRWGGYVDLSLLDASALAEGPVTDRMSVAVAFRRSIVDVFLPLFLDDSDEFTMTTSPTYYDYQAKWTFRPRAGQLVTLDVYGAWDRLGFETRTVSDSDPAMVGQFDIDFQFHGAYAHYRYDGGRIKNDLSPGYSYILQRAGYVDGKDVEGGVHTLLLRDDLSVRLGERHTLRAGVLLRAAFGSIVADYYRPPKEGDVDWSGSNQETVRVDASNHDLEVAAYLMDEMRLGWLTLTPGFRLTYDVDLEALALGPRLGARWRVARPLTLKAALGLYNRLPDGDETAPGFGNDGLDYEKAVHVVAGVEWEITGAVRAELQGYYKQMYDLVHRTRDLTAPEDGRIYENGARGVAFGGELLLQARFSEKLFGWLSYSISRSERTDGPGTGYRLHDLDQTHNLVALGSWEFYRGWRLGLRFQVTSGTPYTAVAGGVFQGDTGAYNPVHDLTLKNASRGAAYHRLDLRVDKRWVFNAWILHAYLDIQNVYYHANPVAMIHNYDYSEHSVMKGIPILPSVGLKGAF